MLKVSCKLKGITPVTFNKKLMSEKGPNETHDDLEKRVWRERCDCNGNGNLILSPSRFKKALMESAKWLRIKIEGEGQATFSKQFRGGVVIMNAIDLGVNSKDVEHELIYTAPRKNDGKRWIHFPIVRKWGGNLEVNIFDEKITEDVFRKVINYAGMCIGIGSWRPENGGENGRFEVVDIEFETV